MMSAAASTSPLASASGFALLLRQQATDLAGTFAHQAGRAAHDRGAFVGRHLAPGLEATLRASKARSRSTMAACATLPMAAQSQG
jgi:hypothetical protein